MLETESKYIPPLTQKILASFLQRKDVKTYFDIHPNQLGSPAFSPPSEWLDWWHWASVDSSEETWWLLWQFYVASPGPDTDRRFANIPLQLRDLISAARQLQLPRTYV